jgi:hypothetical protein
MKLSKEELISKINELPIDDEVKISLLEDVTDSMEVTDNSETEELRAKYEELKNKYKERFLQGENETTEETEKEEELTEEEEEEVIDIKEI